MKDILLKDWGWIRVSRLLFGLYLIYTGYVDSQVIYYLIGGFLLYQVAFNIKCIGGTCPTDQNFNNNTKKENE